MIFIRRAVTGAMRHRWRHHCALACL